jgi:hypothetical protein
VASVAKIGVTFKTAIKIEFIAPQRRPISIPTRQAIKIQLFEIAPSSLIFCVMM